MTRPVDREHAQKLAEESVLQVCRSLDEIEQADYAGAHKQLRTFIAHVTADIENNRLDTGSLMLLGAATITLLREAVLKWPDQVNHRAVPVPPEPS